MDLTQLSPHLRNIYEEMQNTQTYIHSEILMAKEIDQYSNQVLTKKVNEQFIQQNIKFKQYYAVISMIYLLEKCEQKRLPFANVKSFCTKKFEPTSKNIENEWGFENVLQKLILLNGNEGKYKDLIDLVTFSLVPSLSLEFLEANSINKFIEFVGKLPPTLQPLLSRSIFVSPFFLQFIHLIFYYDLKPFYEGIFTACFPYYNNSFQKNIQNKFLASIKLNIHLLPSYISLFLNSFKNIRQRELILKQAFFHQIIKYPAMFSIVNHHICENEDQYLAVSNFLKQLFTDDFIHEFDQIIISSIFFKDTFLNQQYSDKYYSSFKNCKIFSNIDEFIMEEINAIDTKLTNNEANYDIYELIKGKKIQNYYLFRGKYSDDEDDFDINNPIYQQSLRQENDGWSHAKDLLKKSPPLPSLPQIDNDAANQNDNKGSTKGKPNFISMINSTLVNKYDPMNSISDFLTYNMIRNSVRNISHYKTEFQKMKTEHNEVKEAITAGHILKSEINKLTINIEHILISNSEYFISYMTKNENISIKIPTKIHEIVSNPIQTIEKLISYTELAYETIKPITGNADSYSILAQRYYSNFRFNDFLALRSDLIKYDQKIQNCLVNNFHVIKEIITDKAKELDSGEKIFLKTLQYQITDFDIYSKKVITAFESNSDPISKTSDILSAIQFFLDKFGQDPGIGPDAIINMTEFLLAYANPPHMLSNIIYIMEFCNFKESCGKVTKLCHEAYNVALKFDLIIRHLHIFDLDLEKIPRINYEDEEAQRPIEQNNEQTVRRVNWYQKIKNRLFKK